MICSLNSSASADRDYDAVVKDRSTDPPKVTYVQLTTTTFDRNEARQMKYFLKHRWTTRWGQNYVLVVSFDDFMWFGTEDDRAALRSFVSERLAAWRLNVATLYVVGISGRTFESFPVPRL